MSPGRNYAATVSWLGRARRSSYVDRHRATSRTGIRGRKPTGIRGRKPMAKFIIQPHGRLQEWIADHKGYFP